MQATEYIYGPAWRYVNPLGVAFTAYNGEDVRILQMAERSLRRTVWPVKCERCGSVVRCAIVNGSQLICKPCAVKS